MNRHSTAAMNAHQRLEVASNLAGLSDFRRHHFRLSSREIHDRQHLHQHRLLRCRRLQPPQISRLEFGFHAVQVRCRVSGLIRTQGETPPTRFSDRQQCLPSHETDNAGPVYFVQVRRNKPRLMLIYQSTAVKQGAESRRTDISPSNPYWSSV
jgi:hypothetical protein